MAQARESFDSINAPHKEFVLLPWAGHFAPCTQPDKFLHELSARVRPLLL